MGDRLRAGIPSRYVTNQLGRLSLASLRGRLIEYQLRLGQGRECQLCGPMWHVSSRSGVATLRTAIHLLLTFSDPTRRTRPVEYQLRCIPQSSTGQTTEQATGSRMADSLHLPSCITYDGWKTKVPVFDIVYVCRSQLWILQERMNRLSRGLGWVKLYGWRHRWRPEKWQFGWHLSDHCKA